MTADRFTLSGFAATADPFGVWEVPAPEVKTVSTEDLTWRAELPNAESGLDAVQARAEVLQRGDGYLTRADAELRAMFDGIAAAAGRGVAGADSYVFAVPAAESFHPQKQALRALLGGFTASASTSPTGAVAFGAVDVFAAEKEHESFQAACRRWLAFVEQVKQLMTLPADAETVIAGELVGLTRIDWKGDLATFWSPGLLALSREVHRQNVNLVLASRMALLRVVSVVASGAGGLAVKVIALPPGAQALLFPAVVRFIFDVMDALRAWDAVPS